MSFGIVKGVSVIIGPLIAATLHPSKGSSPSHGGEGGWGGYGFTGAFQLSVSSPYILTIISRYHRVRWDRNGGDFDAEHCVRLCQTSRHPRCLLSRLDHLIDSLPHKVGARQAA